jgi:FtsP/CotA-like multicopper oxidase with cupredoxin domain
MKPVFYREIDLAPGEEYSLVVKFNDYIKLIEPGLYIVQAVFFPDLYMAETSPALASNKLSLNVRPAVESGEQRGMIEAQIEKALQRDDMPPDEVVAYTLRARMVDQWSKFFLYINLEELYINSFLKTKDNRDQYNKLPEQEKRAKVDGYRKQIMDGKAEWYLVLRPHTFDIIETNYTPFNATVKVRQVYQHPDYKEPRVYTYILKRASNSWEIINYTVENTN